MNFRLKNRKRKKTCVTELQHPDSKATCSHVSNPCSHVLQLLVFCLCSTVNNLYKLISPDISTVNETRESRLFLCVRADYICLSDYPIINTDSLLSL